MKGVINMDGIIPFDALIQRTQSDTDMVNQERISLYKDFMTCLYELKNNPLLLYYDNDTTKTLHDIIPNLRLVSSKKLTKYFSEFFNTINSNVNEYAEKETKIVAPSDENGSESDWKYYDELVDKLRKDCMLNTEYFEKQIKEFTNLVQKELHIK